MGSLGGGGRTMLIVPFGSAAARSFAPPAYSGYGRYTPPIGPSYSEGSLLRILTDDVRLVTASSFHHRLRAGVDGGAIRDDLTNTTLENPYDLSEVDLMAPHKSHAERIAERMQAMHVRYAEKGWAALRSGQALEAMAQFENVLLLAPDELDAKVGRLVAAVQSAQYDTAVACLKGLSVRHADLFTVQRSLGEALGSHGRGEDLLKRITDWAETHASDESYVALHAYLLWVDGQQSRAQSLAEKLNRDHPASTFAGFAERMRLELEPDDSFDMSKLPKLRALSGFGP
jgi:hypothetical protein